MTSTTLKIAQKYLMSRPFFENGIEYQFISVEPDEDWAIKFIVNVILPKKGQSFIVDKFSVNIGDIIGNISKFTGEGISYTEKILIGGKPAPESGIYINEEDIKEIFHSLNENVKYVEVMDKREFPHKRVGANISFIPADKKKLYSMDSHQYISFDLLYNLQNIKVNDESVGLNMKFVGDFAEVFNEKLIDSDSFREKLHDIVFEVLEPSLHILNNDFYYNVNYWINKVEGINVGVTNWGSNGKFTDDMFN